MTKKAQALLFVFFLLLLVGILAGALALSWGNEIQTRSWEKEGLAAFYLAQAGIEQAKIWARNNPPGPFPYSSGPINLGGGSYSFTITDAGGSSRTLISTGQAWSVPGNILAERQIRADVQGIGSPPESQTAWTWREQ